MKTPLAPYWNLFARYLKPHRPWAVLLALLILGNITLQLVSPLVMRRFIDAATQPAQADAASTTLARSALLFLGLAILHQIVSVAVTYVGRDVGWRATNALRVDLARHCLCLDMSFHHARTPGEMIERIDSDVNALSNLFSQFAVQMAGNVLLLVGIIVLLFGTDWRAGTAIAVFGLAALLIIGRLQNTGASLWEAQRQANADLFGFLEERLQGTEDIRSCGAKAYVMRRFFQLLRTAHQTLVKAGTIGAGITYNTANILFATGTAAALAVGAHLYRQGTATIGTVYLIFQYTALLSQPIAQITRQMQDLQRAGAGVARVRELFAFRTRIEDRPSAQPREAIMPGRALAVAFRNVSFGYEAEVQTRGTAGNPAADPEAGPSAKQTVLEDLSFHLLPGTVLGLLGRTGSGKTTVSRLLFRLYDPDEGAICLGHDADMAGEEMVDLRALPLADLRRRVGLATQDIQLFQASVRDNLTFFDLTIPDERILRAIHELGLGPWLASLPQGLDTELASSGGGLSAGEAQLLALTRIFLQDPGLVILDEASSRLDPATERLLEGAVDRLIQGRTAIVIAHRLGTVGRADEILILEEGRACEHGRREELARDPSSRFYRLLQTGLEEVLA